MNMHESRMNQSNGMQKTTQNIIYDIGYPEQTKEHQNTRLNTVLVRVIHYNMQSMQENAIHRDKGSQERKKERKCMINGEKMLYKQT